MRKVALTIGLLMLAVVAGTDDSNCEDDDINMCGYKTHENMMKILVYIFNFISFIISIYYTATLWDTPLIVGLSCRSSLHSHPSVPLLCASPLG